MVMDETSSLLGYMRMTLREGDVLLLVSCPFGDTGNIFPDLRKYPYVHVTT